MKRCELEKIIEKTRFFKGVLGTRFGSLEFQIGSLASEKIIIGSLISEKIGALESEKSGPLQILTGYLTFSLKKNLKDHLKSSYVGMMVGDECCLIFIQRFYRSLQAACPVSHQRRLPPLAIENCASIIFQVVLKHSPNLESVLF